MKADDRIPFAELLAMVSEIYSREVSREKARAWFALLRDHDIGRVREAFMAHMRDPDQGRFMPTPAHILGKLTPDAGQEALVEWAKVLPLLSNSRRARSENPIVERVVADLGGWVRLGMTPQDKLVWVEKEFARRYAMYAELGVDLPQRIGHRGGLQRIGATA